MDNKLIFTAFISLAVSLLSAFPPPQSAERYWRDSGAPSRQTSINYWHQTSSSWWYSRATADLVTGVRPTGAYLIFIIQVVECNECNRVFVRNSLHIFIVINCSEYPHGRRRLWCPPPLSHDKCVDDECCEGLERVTRGYQTNNTTHTTSINHQQQPMNQYGPLRNIFNLIVRMLDIGQGWVICKLYTVTL